MKDLKSELGDNLEEVTLAMMEPCELFDAKSLRKAMKVFVCCLHACMCVLRTYVCVCVRVCLLNNR